MEQVRGWLSQIVRDLYDQEVDISISRPDEQFGDYSTNIAMQLAKTFGKNPQEVAKEITEKLTFEEIKEAKVAGPGFINITLRSSTLARNLADLVKQAPNGVYGSNASGKDRVVLCEFPSPNMAKPFSVGHIRSALQGSAMAQLMRLNGYTVITDNHVGDTGTPFGKWVVGYIRYSSPEKLENGGINELARVYIEITKDIKEEKADGGSEIADEVQSWLKRLESGDEEAVGYSERFNNISFEHMHTIMKRLNIATDYEYGESKFVSRGKELAVQLLNDGVARESDGAIVVDLEDYGISTPVMLRKANGAALYATTDLATIEFRDKEWGPEKVFIHTGQEQAFYFRQLNALAKKSGHQDNIIHLWHGLVDQLDESGNRGKMSSRKGVVLLGDLLDEAEKRAMSFARDGSDEDAKAIALAAVKFTDFMADRKKGVLFDWDNMFNAQGFSGPAVQYAAVRIKSILSKATSQAEIAEANYDWEAEHSLLLELLAFPDLILELSTSYELHTLASYLYGLARKFNAYYETTPILKSEPNQLQSRKWLLEQVEQVFSTGLNVLGISIPEKM